MRKNLIVAFVFASILGWSGMACQSSGSKDAAPVHSISSDREAKIDELIKQYNIDEERIAKLMLDSNFVKFLNEQPIDQLDPIFSNISKGLQKQ
ncbi:MAG TPA: hypothetical protein PKA00_08960 [Saprospiraceae bacterium]|nr:hypothetical protein [Saprospiraceae bacterium]HMQ83025.1 hypothetical protein [Saprospiraceae bacterium]